MKWLSSSSTGMNIRYSPKHIIPPIAQRYLGSPTHPIRPKIDHMWATRDTNTLWWRVSVAPIGHLRRVVRSWCARRTRIAFEQALSNQGYNNLGIPLQDSSTPQKHNLTGSLELVLRPSCVNLDFKVVQKDADSLLRNILKQRSMHFEHTAQKIAKPSKTTTRPAKPPKASKRS
ncbi:hypothetical protein N7466_010185 [Penicillium verhagenii]|uniref:uncharacterized protein n=1 Tax=Penicillium verhagenii TaxID=1562060 RepID=UPI002544F148|nr:uncharacterized protein N7466_010185 [Penicillium verhagenii]KAJ5919242.1 hypothetical protein N7466_010185 [Penicillium verhagenii]